MAHRATNRQRSLEVAKDGFLLGDFGFDKFLVKHFVSGLSMGKGALGNLLLGDCVEGELLC